MRKLRSKKRAAKISKPTATKPVKVTAKYILESDNDWTDDVTFTSMVKLLEEVDFTDMPDEYFGFSVEYSDEGDYKRDVGFKIRWESEFCCGCIEIGELSSAVAKTAPMNRLFKKLLEEMGNRTIILTTIQDQVSWEEYLNTSDLFKPVKTFMNTNTNNDVTIWVSTNQP